MSRLDDENRQKLQSDIKKAHVITQEHDKSFIEFGLTDYERPANYSRIPYPVEGRLTDDDGAILWLIVFKDVAGHLWELELIRWDGKDVINPAITSFEPMKPQTI